MIVCPNCGKENQDHYKFCLGCGAKLPAPGQAAAPPAPPSAVPPPAAPPAYAQPPRAPAPAPAYPPPPPQPAPPPAPGYPPPPPAQAYPPPPQGQPPAYGQQPAQAPMGPYGGQPYAQPYSGQPVPPQPTVPAQPGPYGQPQQGTYGQPPRPHTPPHTPQGPHGQPQPPPAPAPTAGPRACPNCGTENPPQFKFCGACGNSLAALAPAPAPAAPPPDPAAAKTMFMDPNQRPPTPAPQAGLAKVRLVLLRDDGTEGGVLVIEGGPERIGRSHGPPFDSDAYLDPDHADLSATPEGLSIDDLDSLNGVYLKLDGRTELRDRDFFRVGQELLLYEDLPEPATTADGTERMGSPNPGYWGRVSVMLSPTRPCSAFPIMEGGVTIGRENGEITFPEDGYVSGTHCSIVGDDDGVFLEDLGSSNGTYIRVRKDQQLPAGSLILIGQQLFRIEI